MTIDELQQKASFIDWCAHFDDAFRLLNRKITDKERVVVYAPKYLEDLTSLVKRYQETAEGKT